MCLAQRPVPSSAVLLSAITHFHVHWVILDSDHKYISWSHLQQAENVFKFVNRSVERKFGILCFKLFSTLLHTTLPAADQDSPGSPTITYQFYIIVQDYIIL